MAFVFMVDRFRKWRNFYMLAATAAAQASITASWVAVAAAHRYLGIRRGAIVQLADFGGHQLGGHRGPAAVFHQGKGAVVQAQGFQVLQQVGGGQVNAAVVGGGGQHNGGCAPALGNGFAVVDAGKVMHSNLYALGGNFGGQSIGGACGVAVHAAVQHNNRLFRVRSGSTGHTCQ